MRFINEFDKIFDPIQDNYEPWEISLCNQFLPSDSIVLELGGRLGIVSCFINQKLSNKHAHVVVEPNEKYIEYLNINKTKNYCHFEILKGAISKIPLHYNPAQELCYPCSLEESNIKTYSYQDAVNLLGLTSPTFNTIVADCEGAFERFLKENLDQIRNWNYVHLEADFSDKCNYNWIDETLLENGFSKTSYNIQHIYRR